MRSIQYGRLVFSGVMLAGIATLSACGPKAPPPKELPPPPPQIVVPPQPRPPLGASTNVPVPPLLPNGTRQTVNTGVSAAQALWNLRSAYNVAALNCMKPEHAAILEGYRAFLRNNTRALTAANRTVDQEFKTRFGTTFVRSREAYMTQVYNYFALPPTIQGFCDAALAVSNEAQTVKPADINGFAVRSLNALDGVFQDFFLSYDQYRTDLAGWQARYVPTQPPALTLPATPLQSSASPAAAAPGQPQASIAR